MVTVDHPDPTTLFDVVDDCDPIDVAPASNPSISIFSGLDSLSGSKSMDAGAGGGSRWAAWGRIATSVRSSVVAASATTAQSVREKAVTISEASKGISLSSVMGNGGDGDGEQQSGSPNKLATSLSELYSKSSSVLSQSLDSVSNTVSNTVSSTVQSLKLEEKILNRRLDQLQRTLEADHPLSVMPWIVTWNCLEDLIDMEAMRANKVEAQEMVAKLTKENLADEAVEKEVDVNDVETVLGVSSGPSSMQLPSVEQLLDTVSIDKPLLLSDVTALPLSTFKDRQLVRQATLEWIDDICSSSDSLTSDIPPPSYEFTMDNTRRDFASVLLKYGRKTNKLRYEIVPSHFEEYDFWLLLFHRIEQQMNSIKEGEVEVVDGFLRQLRQTFVNDWNGKVRSRAVSVRLNSANSSMTGAIGTNNATSAKSVLTAFGSQLGALGNISANLRWWNDKDSTSIDNERLVGLNERRPSIALNTGPLVPAKAPSTVVTTNNDTRTHDDDISIGSDSGISEILEFEGDVELDSVSDFDLDEWEAELGL